MPRTSVLILFLLLAPAASAQLFLNEDFAAGAGLTPPPGWMTMATGSTTAPWRWDNPGSRTFTTPTMSAPFAITDSDNAGSLASGVSTLISPAMNIGAAAPVNLSFDQQFYDLSSGWSIEVFDGAVWNVVAFQANNTVSVNIGYGMTPDVVNTTYDITAAAGGSAAAQLRWVYTYGWDWWWALDNVKVEHPLAVDMAVLSIDAPVNDPLSCDIVTGSQPVTITIENRGTVAIPTGTFIQLQYDVNGGPPNIEFLVLTAPMNYLDTMSYTFILPATLSAPGPNTITASVVYPGDLDPASDSVSESMSGVGPQGFVGIFPYLETFDSVTGTGTTQAPVGWIQDPNDGAPSAGAEWFFRANATPTAGTGPAADHSTGTGHYAYVEDDFIGASANLISPCFDLSAIINPQLRFWLHSNNNNTPTTTFENFLSVDVIAYPGGTVTTDFVGPLGHQGSAWTMQNANLSPFFGQTVQLVFRATTSGGSNSHDIAIDDVSVYDPQPTPGQAPQLGLAEFDINSALNVNASPVYSGNGGPYFAYVTVGGIMAMSIKGELNMPLALLAGPLNPGIASYPNIGQFDIGSTVAPNGIPTQIFVLGDGFGATTLFNAFFNTGPTGTVELGFQIPNFPLGPLATFQTAVATTNGFFVALSNAVDVSIL